MKFTRNLLIAACLVAGSLTIAPQIASAMPIAPSAQSQADTGLVQQARRVCPYGMHRSPYGCVRDRYYGYGRHGYGRWNDYPRRYYRY
ncbi:hypothetical protein LMIY3S_03147 [Labrys miyagiensis]